MNIYYIVTSDSNKTVFCSNNFIKIYEFILENQDARFRTVDYTGKAKILNRKLFLRRFLKFTKDKIKFFTIARIIIPIPQNIIAFITEVGMVEEWNAFKSEFK